MNVDWLMYVCRWDVAAVCQGADAAALAARAQVCVLVTSLAALEAAREALPGLPQRARAAAGFSLGEVTALVFAGAIDLEPALRFVSYSCFSFHMNEMMWMV